MRLSWEPLTLDLKTPFRIAHGTYHQRHNVLVRLDEGLGEAPAVVYYGETQESIMAYLATVPDLGDDPFDLDAVLRRLPPGSRAARAAIDVALHDLWGRRLGHPLYRLFGLNPVGLPLTSFTIAMDEPEEMARQAKASGYPVIKIKLGSPRDAEIVAAIRKATDARLRVDANAGWSREEAARLIPRLAEHGLELVEQPLAAEDVEGLRWLRDRMRAEGVKVPIVADESVHTAQDVARLAGAVDGVVVKLMKTLGIRGALAAIHTARALDMQVMLSCMVESSLGVTAAAHLAPLCDYVDLDGPLLIKRDPFTGLAYDGAQLALPEGPGLGVQPAQA
ncbi:MAG TPA: dipeptide epimerase [Holophaga sp.]|nr:dipeptide epimerase [Holophaga sp.]